MPPIRNQIVKSTSGHTIRIPTALLEQARLDDVDKLEIRIEEGRITIEPLKAKLALESLVARITPENRYEEQDWGMPIGHEIW